MSSSTTRGGWFGSSRWVSKAKPLVPVFHRRDRPGAPVPVDAVRPTSESERSLSGLSKAHEDLRHQQPEDRSVDEHRCERTASGLGPGEPLVRHAGAIEGMMSSWSGQLCTKRGSASGRVLLRLDSYTDLATWLVLERQTILAGILALDQTGHHTHRTRLPSQASRTSRTDT